jgi:type IV pilus assembly protein PilB
MVASSLVGVIAQRLVRMICQECSVETLLEDPADLRLVGKTEPTTIRTAKPGGCKNCRSTGYTGRSAIHEIIIPGNAIKECISRGGTAEEIGDLARENGTKLLRDNVTDMVLAGTTSMDELVKATYTV